MKHCAVAIILLSLLVSGISAQGPMIIDHTCTDYTQIPESWIQTVKDNLLIGYGHTSHGSQLVSGMETIENTFGGVWSFNMSGSGHNPGVFFNDNWAGGDLGHNGDLTWRNDTLTLLQDPANDRNVIMWSWCGGCSDNTPAGIDTYLNAMNQLEIDYPGITFIYMTGHLDGTGDPGTLHASNEQIRTYCQDNNKILFDFADIESFDPDCLVNYRPLLCNDECDYDSDGNMSLDANWAEDWVAANPAAELTTLAGNCSYCAHSHGLNCSLKGAATWWMLARIAGWEGPETGPTTPTMSQWGLIVLLIGFSGILIWFGRRG